MKKILQSSFLICLVMSLTTGQQITGKNFVFDVADLTVDYPDLAGGTVNLQGFQISDNLKIIDNKLTERYGELMWVSVGNPRVTVYNTTTGTSATPGQSQLYPEMFAFREDGFNVAISMLNDAHRQKLKEIVKRKYGIDISPSQIVNLVLSEMQCQLDFYKLNSNVKMSVFGTVRNLINYPLIVSFDAPKWSSVRAEFEKKLKSYAAQNSTVDQVDLTIDCVMKSEAKATKTNYFSVSSLQIATLGIVESIFGPASSSVYVTRDQLQELAFEIYTKLRVYEEYQISSERFQESFTSELISKVSAEGLKYVSLDQALASLSTYNIYQDLRPDVIRDDLGKVFTIASLNGKEYVKADKAYAESTSESSSTSASASGSFKKLFSASANYAQNRQKQWQIGTSSADEQLAELNRYAESQIEWERRGEMIVPKSIKVSRLSRAFFSKGITVQRIFRVSVDASFEKSFVIEPSHYQFEDKLGKLLTEQDRLQSEQQQVVQFVKDSFGHASTVQTVDGSIKSNMGEIKTSTRLSLVPRGTILQVALGEIRDLSFTPDGLGTGDYDGWVICDGRNGAPDLRARFLVGMSPLRSEYSEIGKTGGSASVLLRDYHIPDHRHSINLNASPAGDHVHSYKDVFHSLGGATPSHTIDVPFNGAGSKHSEGGKRGLQMDRVTEAAGSHHHHISGWTDPWHSTHGITQAELDIRPEFYTVTYIMFTGIYGQKSASQAHFGI